MLEKCTGRRRASSWWWGLSGQGPIPDQITQVIHSSTNLAYILPRIMLANSGEGQPSVDSQLRESLNHIAIYPLSKFNGPDEEERLVASEMVPGSGAFYART